MSVIGGAVRETGASLATVVRNRDLRRVNAALAGSLTGDWAYATAVTVWAYHAGGAAAVGIFGTVRLAFLAAATPFAAGLGDRFPRKRVMVAADAVRAVLVLGAAALLAWRDGSEPAVYVLAVLASVAGAPFRPAQMALLPAIVETPDELTAANGVASTLESLAFFVGPALAGLLLAVSDVSTVFVLNALTFMWSAALVLGVRGSGAPAGRPRSRVPVGASPTDAADHEPTEQAATGPGYDGEVGPVDLRPPSPSGFLAESAAGFREIWRHPTLRLVVGLYCAQTVVAGASLVFGVSIAIDLIDLGPAGVGYLDSALGVGALGGGLLAVALVPRRRLASDFGWGVVFWAVPLLLVAIWPSVLTAFLAMAVIGVANPVVDVDASTILQRIVPDAVLSRVFGALESALITTMALGSLLMPLLIATVGLRWGLSALAVPIAALALASLPVLRRMDVTIREPEGVGLLRSVTLFQPLARPLLENLAHQLQPMRAATGDVVVSAGEVGDRFYVIESGLLEARHDDRLLSRMGPGDCFGEIALLHDVPRTATVVATEDAVLQTLGRDEFLAAVTRNGDVHTRAEALATRRLRTT